VETWSLAPNHKEEIMPIITLIQTWKKLILISATLYIPCIALTYFLLQQQNQAISFAAAILIWGSYLIHASLFPPTTNSRSLLDQKERLLF